MKRGKFRDSTPTDRRGYHQSDDRNNPSAIARVILSMTLDGSFSIPLKRRKLAHIDSMEAEVAKVFLYRSLLYIYLLYWVCFKLPSFCSVLGLLIWVCVVSWFSLVQSKNSLILRSSALFPVRLSILVCLLNAGSTHSERLVIKSIHLKRLIESFDWGKLLGFSIGRSNISASEDRRIWEGFVKIGCWILHCHLRLNSRSFVG